MVLSESKKAAGRYCCAYGCKNKPIKRKGGLCHKHYRRKRREIDPVAERYNNFCGNAAKRNKENSVTLAEFRALCERTGYIITKGMRGKNATLDRRCNAHGYHIWNIQILTLSANCRKGTSHNENEDRFYCPF